MFKETGKNRGLKREAKLILPYYVPHEPLSRWIPPWAPKQKQSSLAPGFSWSPNSPSGLAKLVSELLATEPPLLVVEATANPIGRPPHPSPRRHSPSRSPTP